MAGEGRPSRPPAMDGESPRSVARGDLATGLVLLAAAAACAWSLLGNDELTAFDYGADPGPGLVPELLLVVLGSFAAALALKGLVGLRRAAREARETDRRGTPPGAGATGGDTSGRTASDVRRGTYPSLLVATLLLYALGLPVAGFVAATVVFTGLWSILLGRQEAGELAIGSSALFAIEALAITSGVYVVFAWLIKVPLP